MDEPLSNLDAKLRAEMRTELSELQRRLATTMIYVTHDQAEAMTLGDRVAVLNNGSLLQVGTPDEIYARPDDLFVAGCLGNPTINTFTARLVSGPGSGQVVYADQRLQLDQQELRRHRIQPGPDQDVIVGIRPEALQAASDAPGGGQRARADGDGGEARVSGLGRARLHGPEPGQGHQQGEPCPLR